MIELNKKTQQDFLNRKWVQRLLDAGVGMSDAKYVIGKDVNFPDNSYICLKSEKDTHYISLTDVMPTYTISELLYKLHEWIYPTIDGKKYSGGLRLMKDAPFYIAFYDLEDEEGNSKDDYIYAEPEYPIEAFASLLIQCHKKDIGFVQKDTRDISEK